MGEQAQTRQARQVGLAVIHCSATPNEQDLFGPGGTPTPVERINEWHRERGFHRLESFRHGTNPALDAIGYHFVIYRSGVVVTGRALDEIGAHVAGYNSRSVGICLVGMDKFTSAQWTSLAKLCRGLEKRYPGLKFCGHRDLSPDKNGDGRVEPFEWLKTCPNFDVSAWLERGMEPAPENVAEAPAHV